MGVRSSAEAVHGMRGRVGSAGRPSNGRREMRVRFWEAIARGSSSADAAKEAGVSQAVGTRWFRQSGGIPPDCLAPVSGRYLSFAEREEIAILRAQGVSIREIGRRLGRAPSTISRELRRNASTRSRRVTYRATVAQWHAGASGPASQGLQAQGQRRSARSTCWIAFRAGLFDLIGSRFQDRRCVGPAVVEVGVRIGAGRRRGALSRSPIGFGLTFRRTTPFGSLTKRFIRRSTSKVEAVSSASWLRV